MSKDGRKMSPMHVTLKAGVSSLLPRILIHSVAVCNRGLFDLLNSLLAAGFFFFFHLDKCSVITNAKERYSNMAE